ncbi:MAG: YraN family protein [Candidatus Aminicenantales bacterium]
MTEDRLTPRALGLKGEAIALAALRKKKYAVVETGYRLFRGEIDIIAYDGTTLVFVEVKTRAGTEFGLPEDAVTPAKQSQIKRIARGYLAAKGLEDADCRFDVVAILFADDGRWTITHFEDAF